jgi:hypothetical protein
MTARQEVLKRMEKNEDFFLQNIVNNGLFRAELECAKKIRLELEKEKPTPHDVDNILSTYNDTQIRLNYKSTGWMDFQLLLRHVLEIDGFNVDIDDLTSLMKPVAG